MNPITLPLDSTTVREWLATATPGTRILGKSSGLEYKVTSSRNLVHYSGSWSGERASYSVLSNRIRNYRLTHTPFVAAPAESAGIDITNASGTQKIRVHKTSNPEIIGLDSNPIYGGMVYFNMSPESAHNLADWIKAEVPKPVPPTPQQIWEKELDSLGEGAILSSKSSNSNRWVKRGGVWLNLKSDGNITDRTGAYKARATDFSKTNWELIYRGA